MTTEDDLTPIDRPLLRSDLNDIREIVHRTDQMLVDWYEENKLWRKQSDELARQVSEVKGQVVEVKRQLWLPALISVIAAAAAWLARVAP